MFIIKITDKPSHELKRDDLYVHNKETIHELISPLSTIDIFVIVRSKYKKRFFNFNKDSTMNDLSKDILITVLFLIGLTGFISGEFIISSTLFAAAAIASNVCVKHKCAKTGQLSWD